jgi:hypothetical protein
MDADNQRLEADGALTHMRRQPRQLLIRTSITQALAFSPNNSLSKFKKQNTSLFATFTLSAAKTFCWFVSIRVSSLLSRGCGVSRAGFVRSSAVDYLQPFTFDLEVFVPFFCCARRF